MLLVRHLDRSWAVPSPSAAFPKGALLRASVGMARQSRTLARDARLTIQTIISSRISSQATLSVFVIPYGRGGAMTQQPAIWIGTIEIRLSDEVKPHAFRSAFTVVTTWAVSPAEFRERCIGCRGTTDGSCSALNELTPCRKRANLARKLKTCWREPELIQAQSSTAPFILIP